jgi:hypothetical protein
MTLELVMNQDGTVGHDTGSLVSGGSFIITSVPSTKTKVEGKGVYRGPLAGTFVGGNATGFVPGSVAGAWTIAPTAVACRDDGLPVIRAGDTGTLAGVGTIAPPAVPPTGPVVGNVVVSNAGQAVVNGD